ncbi:interferon regulatory factor 5 isoform X4 [Balearica regulorum gibbericeps]|uniref:interferon regulatory factor 5 isoform X4 n=1 Tax=Balearica regulorum gibbericeps TaxID=100784 RepID=UPI003F602F5E
MSRAAQASAPSLTHVTSCPGLSPFSHPCHELAGSQPLLSPMSRAAQASAPSLTHVTSCPGLSPFSHPCHELAGPHPPPPARVAGTPLPQPRAPRPAEPAMDPPARRVRLKPWLVAQVDSRRYPGLHWLDPERRRFAIPWRHATRHPPAPQDHDNIFKAWAQETGKFRAGLDAPDPARWKANLRCALNKSREFRLLFDGPRAAPPQPYKVYELCQGPPEGADGVPEDDYGCDEEEEDVSQLQKMTSLSISDTQHGGDLLPPYPWPKEEPPFGSGCPLGPFAPPPPALLPGEGGGTHGTLELPPAALAETGPPLGTLGPPAACPLAPMEHVIPNLLISPHMLPLTDLELKFQYRGRQVCVLTISNPHGCRLFHSSLEPTQEQVELFGPLTLEQVRFPATDAIPNEKQRFYTHQLLDVLDRGLILELQGQDIYAIRLCQCKVFWTGPCAGPRAGPNPIEREKKTKLFSLEGFLNDLILFQKGQTSTPPPFEIFFCFGEEWPDQKPKEKKLITVQFFVVFIVLEMATDPRGNSTRSSPGPALARAVSSPHAPTLK